MPYYCVKMYDGTEPLQDKAWYASTNGMSAGSTRDEAILAGLYEVIERDGVHLAMNKVTFSGKPLDRLDLDSVDDAEAQALIDRIEDAGAMVFIYDCRNELGIPTFQCILVDREKGTGMYKGYGCNADKHIALSRSICEAANSCRDLCGCAGRHHLGSAPPVDCRLGGAELGG